MYFFLFVFIFASVLFGKVYNGDSSKGPTDMKAYFPKLKGDMTQVTWVPRCNTRAKLEEALSSDKMMIESDIIVGHLESDQGGEQIPVMGLSPATTGDISLQEYLNVILNRKKSKGIKLTFKSIDIFKASEDVLRDFLNKPEVDFPVWINADILRGPGVPDTEGVQVVDAKYFLETCVNKFPTGYISVGWTMNSVHAHPFRYTSKHIDEMKAALKAANVPHGVTFHVNSGVAAESEDTLSNLMRTSTAGTTLTLWAAEGERVDYKRLNQLINTVGKDKVYIDMPKEMIDKLRAEESLGVIGILKLIATSVGFFSYGWCSATAAMV